jgi:hypothetical protein
MDQKGIDMDTNTIKVDLNNIEELFGQPAADPFDPASRYISGIDEIVGQLKLLSTRQRRTQHIIISLPQRRNDAALEEKTRVALNRYCDARVQQSQRDLDSVRRKAPRALIYSLVIITVGLTLAGLLMNSVILSDTFRLLLSNGLTIFAWVALWEPAGIYLYEWIPLAGNRHLYQLLKEMELSVEFRP